MYATERASTALNALLNPVQVHNITMDDLRLIIEGDPGDILHAILNGSILVRSISGSSYDIELIGPTVDTKYYAGTAKVRQAKYIRTQANGKQNETVEYIGISSGDTPHLRFFADITDETPDENSEHSILRIPTSATLIPEIKLVVDWSKW
ncbi:MAG: hypothetical protein EOT05_01480 [Candidatus Microsaccharimonas sossegonensis]|uniref:Uncharacterized protein n=1 Tax=Candidatus Microsaccharimonas sossegonensis TaxID=2506948 RepID=A0A4Q0AH50_9BACT|nr:MAG: hypothetical protein EOT05_01480 [Candidatus Microsaccharimonas sossegonensis]